ncbi:MAG TPA: TolC family protein [Bacteroidia bacterium]|nr:TolC family protein [Bacteroidia bacterium]
MNKYILLVCMFIAGLAAKAQSQFTLEEAIELAIKNNYDVAVVNNNAEIAANNNTLGNAGMLPVVDLNASTSFANNASKQQFVSGDSIRTIDRTGVKASNIGSGVYLTWTLFNGLKMFATKDQLSTLEAMGKLSSKIQIENTVQSIVVNYYNVVKQKQLIKGLSENIKISEERLTIAQKKFEVGTGSKLDVLQAKTDMNAQTSSLIRQKTTLEELKITLNQLLARPVEMQFEVSDSIPVSFQMNYDDLKTNYQKTNLSMRYAQENIALSKQQLRMTKADMFPVINLNANYLFSRVENPASQLIYSRNLGLNYGLTASWRIFNGFTLNNRIKNAKLYEENATINLNNIQSQVEQQLLIAFKHYQDDKKVVELEEDNLKLIKEAVSIALERFRIGSSNSIELKEIQQTYDDALVRLADARYTAKVSETNLMKLNGNLVK